MGQDPEAALDEAIRADNACLEGARRPGVTMAIHLCRGNNRSHWYAQGGYDPIAEKLFTTLQVDRFLLEYDDERSGTFEPLRFVPRGKTVVLGLVSSKLPRPRVARRPPPAHRGGVAPRRDGRPRAVAPVRLRLHHGGQPPHGGRPVGQARPGRPSRPGGLGLSGRCRQPRGRERRAPQLAARASRRRGLVEGGPIRPPGAGRRGRDHHDHPRQPHGAGRGRPRRRGRAGGRGRPHASRARDLRPRGSAGPAEPPGPPRLDPVPRQLPGAGHRAAGGRSCRGPAGAGRDRCGPSPPRSRHARPGAHRGAGRGRGRRVRGASPTARRSSRRGPRSATAPSGGSTGSSGSGWRTGRPPRAAGSRRPSRAAARTRAAPRRSRTPSRTSGRSSGTSRRRASSRRRSSRSRSGSARASGPRSGSTASGRSTRSAARATTLACAFSWGTTRSPPSTARWTR